MAKTLIIGEPGATHEGSKEKLFRLLETAAQCGASCFKPQWTSDPIQMCSRRHIGQDHPKRAFYEKAYGWLAFPVEWHAELRAGCRALGMEYACTVFLPQDVAAVAPYVDYLKISSFEAKDRALLAEAKRWHGRVILSTGMGHQCIHLSTYVLDMCPWMLLHCVSAYPAPIAEMNLRAIKKRMGLSDHSRHLLTGAVAVGAGARIIEAHYRLDDCDPSNPDYAVAFTPAEFTQYIQNIRDAEAMLGDGIKRAQPSEAWALPYRVTG